MPSSLQVFTPALRTIISLLTPLGSLILCGVCLHELYARYRARRLPPGISGLRCFFQMPSEQGWLKLQQLNQQYGDIASMSFLGYNVVVIGSAEIARDLLEKRGANYCDRPTSVMGELSGWGKIMILCNYNEWLRTHRKWFAQDIGSYALVTKLHGMIEFDARQYLRCVLDGPENNEAHIRKYYASTVLRLSHGYAIQEGEDPLVELARVASSQFSLATAPGAHYVDFVPLLKYIPSWFPGAGFKRKAKHYTAVIRDLAEIPHNYVKSQLAAGTALPSLTSRVMTQPDLTGELEDSVKWAAATMFQGGADTASSIGYAFWLAMTLYPRVMEKAQQELDTVVGTNRLPTFSDRPALPYMEALFTELLRWHTSSPITLRSTRVDDEYNGYVIPAGSYVLVNIWGMLHDERTYSDPLEFKPERFLGDNPDPHPANVTFSFGRRRCPGYFLAHSTIWLMCAQALAVFNVSKCVENGVEITPEYNIVGETLVHQVPFKCSIKPRSAETERLVRQDVSILEHGETN